VPFLSTLAHNITEHTLSSMLACIITTVGPGLSFHTGTKHQYTLSPMPTRMVTTEQWVPGLSFLTLLVSNITEYTLRQTFKSRMPHFSIAHTHQHDSGQVDTCFFMYCFGSAFGSNVAVGFGRSPFFTRQSVGGPCCTVVG
jgi:hypothetical protein